MNVLKKIIKSAITKRKAVYLMMIILVVMTGIRYPDTTKSLLPDAKFPYVSVYTYMSGASPLTMEKEVTNKIEVELNDIEDLSLMTSSSSYSTSLVVLKFKEDTNIEDKIRLVQSKISNIDHEMSQKAETPVVEEYDINDSPIIMIEVDNRLSYEDKLSIIKDIKRTVKSITGVSKLEVSGFDKRSIEVIPDEKLLEQYGISTTNIINRIKSNQTSLPLGSLEIRNMTYNFQISSEITSVETLENLIVGTYEQKPLYLRDVSDVKVTTETENYSYSISSNKKKSIVTLAVFKKKKGDTVAINKQVKAFVSSFNRENDYGVKLSTALDLSTYISKSINDVINNALSGLLSVIVVLFFFIGIREAIISSAVIPVTLISSFLLFNTFEVTLNIFSIMGLIIALGMLVDNAIVVIEMIDEMKIKNRELSIKEIVLLSTSRVAPAILASTLTTVAALVPLVIMKGDTGSLIREIPLTASIAMTMSFISSITITPVLAVQFIKHEYTSRYKIVTLLFIILSAIFALSNNFELTTLSYISAIGVGICAYVKLFTSYKSNAFDLFSSFIKKVMNSTWKKVLVMIVTVVLLLSSITLLFSDFIQKEAMPEGDDVNQLATIQLVEGSVKAHAEEISQMINEHLLESSYVKKINYSYDNSSIDYMIELIPKEQREIHSKDIIRAYNNYIESIPDVQGRFSSDGATSSNNAISLRLLGNDKEALDVAGKMVVAALNDIKGTKNPRVQFRFSKPTFDMKINKNKCSIYNVSPMAVMSKVRHMTTGESIVSVDRNGETNKVILDYHEPFEDIEEIENVTIKNAHGQNIPLLEVVDMRETRYDRTLTHYEGKNSIMVVAEKEKAYNTNIIMKTLLGKIKNKMPNGVSYRLSGESKQMKETFRDLAEKMIIAAILVYIILVIQFNSYSQPFAIILSIPYAIIGVVLGYGMFRLTFSSLSFLGIVALVGIAVNDAIVLIDYINMLRNKEGYEKIESIIEGAKSRFHPIIATSLTTIAGVLPLALYNEDYSGVAYSLIFGLIFSTVLTLLVVPVTLNFIETLINRVQKGEDYAN